MGINMITTTQIIMDNVIDIHCHIINNVDDGSKSLKDSLEQINKAKYYGIEKIVCTPHICFGKYEKIKKIKENFLILREEANKVGVELYLGTEVLLTSKTLELLEARRLRPINGGKYLLVEVKRNENRSFDEILTLLNDIIDIGYRPVLAHPELYRNYRKLKYMRKLKDNGVLLQLDASSIKGKRKIRKFSKKLLKNRLIDVVASDNHCNKLRNYNQFATSYKTILKKYGQAYTDIIFKENPKIILESR